MDGMRVGTFRCCDESQERNSWIKIIDLYDEYTHAPLDRRVFLARLAQLTGSTAAAIALVPLLEANQARAALVSPRISGSRPAVPPMWGPWVISRPTWRAPKELRSCRL